MLARQSPCWCRVIQKEDGQETMGQVSWVLVWAPGSLALCCLPQTSTNSISIPVVGQCDPM